MKNLLLISLLLFSSFIFATDITFLASSVSQPLHTGTYTNIIIENGAYVELNNEDIFLQVPGKITIKAGGVLRVINDAKIYSDYISSGFIDTYGILVEGDPNYAQDPAGLNDLSYFNSHHNSMKQGLLLLDGVEIYLNRYGIHVIGSGYIKVIDVDFYNCTTGIKMENYSNFIQSSEIRDSRFNNSASSLNTKMKDGCIFISNASRSAFSKNLSNSTNGYNSLKIINCRFSNSTSANYNDQVGIRSVGSFVNVIDCRFKDLNIGFLSEQGIFNYSGTWVLNCYFEGCHRGLVALGGFSVKINGSTFSIPRNTSIGYSNKLKPSLNPVGIFISDAAYYYITGSLFSWDMVPGGGIKPSYGIIVDGNANFSSDLINACSFTEVDIGVQSQNEGGSSFLRCNQFGFGNSNGAGDTYNYDIVVPTGFLKQHDGCKPFVSSNFAFATVPGNYFSMNTSTNHNIKITSTKFPLNSGNKFKYNYYNLSRQLPHEITSNVTINSCSNPSGNPYATGCNGLIINEPFNYIFGLYKTAGLIVDSLKVNGADTSEIEMGEYFKRYFLNELISSISTNDQVDSAISLLQSDTSLLSRYSLLNLFLNSQEYDSAQYVLDHSILGNGYDAISIKELYNILLPIYREYSFERLDSVRDQIDSLAIDSGFIGKQAKYIVNYIDELNSIIDSVEEFIPIYVDSILPVDGIDTNYVSVDSLQIMVYPNPFSSDLFADLTTESTVPEGIKMKLYDSYSNFISETDEYIYNEFPINNTQTLYLNTSELEPGLYFLQFLNAENVVIRYRILYKAQ